MQSVTQCMQSFLDILKYTGPDSMSFCDNLKKPIGKFVILKMLYRFFKLSQKVSKNVILTRSGILKFFQFFEFHWTFELI